MERAAAHRDVAVSISWLIVAHTPFCTLYIHLLGGSALAGVANSSLYSAASLSAFIDRRYACISRNAPA